MNLLISICFCFQKHGPSVLTFAGFRYNSLKFIIVLKLSFRVLYFVQYYPVLFIRHFEALGCTPEGAGSIFDRAIGIFHSLNPSGRTTALGSTPALTEMSTRDLPWGVKTAGT
jgi:hypothetical protein